MAIRGRLNIDSVGEGTRSLKASRNESSDAAELATRKSGNAGKKRSEVQNPPLAIDIRLIVEPHTHTDPELKTERRYTNLSAAEVRKTLLDRGYSEAEVAVANAEMKHINARLQRSKTLPKYDITMKLTRMRGR